MTFKFFRYQQGRWVDPFTAVVVPTVPIRAAFGATADALVVSVNGSASTPSTGTTITAYTWDFGDGTAVSHGAITKHTYAAPGSYTITLTVTDSGGSSGNTGQTVVVKSVALDYIQDATPVLNTLLHPASPTAVAQCLIQSPDTGQWFMTQVHPETTASFSNTDSMRISRMTSAGVLIDQMLCTYGGHGTSIGLEYSGGQIYIWATYFQPASGTSRTHDIVRFPYTPGTYTRAQIPNLQVKIPGGIYRRIQFDWKNGYALLTEDPTWKRYKIADIQAGKISAPLNSINLATNPPTVQGICTYGDSAFLYTGDGADTVQQSKTMPGGPFTLYEYSWKTGQRINKIDLSQMLANSSGTYVNNHVEPEGCTIFDQTGSNPVLNFGLISGPAGTAHTYYVYSFDLLSQGEAQAGQGFTLRETQPTAANVGAGVIRPVSTTHNGDMTISTTGFVLKDTTVNGSVTITAPNVTIENCIINGPTTDPGATTVNPIYLVNTNGSGVATGPALIRYSTITGRWKNPNTYAVGTRNYTLEYCDIAEVVEAARVTVPTAGTNAQVTIRGNYVHDLVFYCPDPNNTTLIGGSNIAGQPLTGTWAGKNWGWSSGVHLTGTAATGVQIYGNNILANWSADSAISTTPLPPAYARLNAIRMTDASGVLIEDNWFDGGEMCVYAPGTGTTGDVRRNRFGRSMATTSTADSGYYALVVTSSGLRTYQADPTNDNTWADTGGTVAPRSTAASAPASPSVPPPPSRDSLIAGSYLPDATTTGLLPGWTKTQLKVVTGNASGTLALADGDLYENCWIQARLLKPTSGTATLRNCWIDGGSYDFTSGPVTALIDCTGSNTGLVVAEDCQLEPRTPGRSGSGVSGYNYAIRRAHIRHVVDGCDVANSTDPTAATNVLVEASLIHDLAYFTPDPTHADNHTHNTCVQLFNGSGALIHGNNLQAMIDTSVSQGGQSVFGAIAAGSAVGYTPSQGAAITDTEVWGNFLDGGQQTVTAVLGNGPSGQDIGYIHDNSFGRNQVAKIESSDPITRQRPILIDAALQAMDIAPLVNAISAADSNGNVYLDTGQPITDYVMANAS